MVINISVQYNGGLLPDIILPVGNPVKYHVVALYLQPLSCILLLPSVIVYYIVSGLLLMFFWCPCMAINVNVQYNGGFLPDIILWTQCYLHRGTCLNAMKWFCICSLLISPKRFDICICSLLIPPKRFDIFSPITGGCSEGLGVV